MSAVELLRGLYDAFGQGNVPGVLGSMDPSIQWHLAEGNPYMPSGEPWVGPDAVLNNLFVKLVEEWDGFTVHPQTFHDAGKIVVVEARYTGTHKATGKDIDAQVCHVWTVENGKVSKFQQYVNTAHLQDVMGVNSFR